MRDAPTSPMLRVAEMACWVALAVGLRWQVGLMEAGVLSPGPQLNGDTLFLPDLIDDLLHGGRLSDWNIPHALYVIPDGVLWLLVSPSRSVQSAVMWFGALHVLLAAFLVRLSVRRTARHPIAGALAPGAFLVIIAFVASGKLVEALDLIRPLHHFGMAVCGFAAFLLLGAWLELRRRATLAWLVALLFTAALSDPFGLTCVVAPIAAVPLLAALRSSARRWAHLGAAALLGVAGAAGYFLAGKLTWVGADLGTVDPNRLTQQREVLLRALHTLQTNDPADLLAMFALGLSVVNFVRGVVALRRPTLSAVLDVTPLVAIVANESALALTGNVVHVLFNRYTLVLFAYLVLVLVRAAAALARWPLLLALVALVVSGASLVRVSEALGDRPRQSVTAWMPEGGDCVVREATARGVKRGIADVLVARPLSLLNGAGLRFDQVEQMRPYWWLVTRRHYAETEPPIGMAVLSYLNPPQLVQAQLGAPDEAVQCGPYQLWFWNPGRRAEITSRFVQLPVRRKGE